jgi:hypothetical protein
MVRSKRLYVGPSVGAGSFATVYTAPADETVILKHLVATCTSSASSSGFLELTSGAIAVTLFAATNVFPFVHREHLWVVMQPGDLLRVWQSAASAWSWVLSGTELEGVAD